jgi:hypothetical protein
MCPPQWSARRIYFASVAHRLSSGASILSPRVVSGKRPVSSSSRRTSPSSVPGNPFDAPTTDGPCRLRIVPKIDRFQNRLAEVLRM